MKRFLTSLLAFTMTGTALAASLTPADVAARIKDPRTAPYLLDVRTTGEFAEGRVPGAKNIPLQELEARLSEVPKDRDVVVYCRSGRRAEVAERLLRERGYDRVSDLEGSMLAWEAANLPVEK